MGSSCEGDVLILCRLLGFAVNSFDRPPQLGAVGPVVYALNEFSPLLSFGILLTNGHIFTILNIIKCSYSESTILNFHKQSLNSKLCVNVLSSTWIYFHHLWYC